MPQVSYNLEQVGRFSIDKGIKLISGPKIAVRIIFHKYDGTEHLSYFMDESTLKSAIRVLDKRDKVGNCKKLLFCLKDQLIK